ncbi:phage tail tape measure protein [Glaesserella parasuis]|nr:phage tail tape measure protein [Glaesserella parasuis]MCT8834550.1 phage tail tape measure protein [Glaesserella parasuis]
MPIRGLEYIISLNDQISAPLKSIKGEIDRIGEAGKDAMTKIGAGAAGIVATGAALYGALQPAIELSNELGKIKGLGESSEGLEILRQRAISFSNTWGEAATEFVAASYDIKSAIDGLTTEELANFTELSAITGKATQTQGQVMTDYLGTMYSVLGASKELDKTKWAEKLLGQTAYTANKFKSDGAKIAEAFTTLGNQATLAGVDIAEQFAILGTLQNEMSGGESATKYAAFLNSIGAAAEGLGIKVHDSQNKLLSTTVILDKIRARFGDSIDDIEAQIIKGELGRKEGVAFINTLLQKNEELKKSIKEIGAIDGMSAVYEGAAANVDVFQQLSHIVKNISASIGSQVLKKITPFLQKIADMGAGFVQWLETYKNIARWLGYIVGGIIALTGLTAALTMFSGVFSAMGVSIKALSLVFKGILGSVGILALKLGLIFYVIYKFRKEIGAFFEGVVIGFNNTAVGFTPLFATFGSIWDSVQRIWEAFSQLFTAIFGGTDSLKTFGSIGEFVGYALGSAFNAFVSIIELIASLIAEVSSIFVDVSNIIISAWKNVLNAWSSSDVWTVFNAIGTGITNIFTRVLDGVKNMFFTFLNWLIDKINGIGEYIGITLPKIEMNIEQDVALPVATASTSATNMALQMANVATTSNFAPKPDANGQIYSLGNAGQAPKLETSPQIGKTITQNRTVDQSLNINGGVNVYADNPQEFRRQIEEQRMLGAA